jgi:hypothetical protein
MKESDDDSLRGIYSALNVLFLVVATSFRSFFSYTYLNHEKAFTSGIWKCCQINEAWPNVGNSI